MLLALLLVVDFLEGSSNNGALWHGGVQLNHRMEISCSIVLTVK